MSSILNPNKTTQIVDGLTQSAEQAIDSTRSYANHALNVADEKVQTLRGNIQPAFDSFTRKAEQLAGQGVDLAMQAKDKARESFSQYSAATGRYVADKPVQSVLIAAAAGAALALLVSSAVNRNRNGH